MAFLIFHSQVGIRMALRILAPVLATLFALYFIFKPEFFVYLAEIVFYESGPLALGLVSTAIALATAQTARSRVCYGLSGWIRHLPSNEIINRRMAVLAILIAQTPVLGVLAAFALISAGENRPGIPLTLCGLFFLGLAAASSVIPTKRKWLRFSAGPVACVLCASGRLPWLIVGIILIAILLRGEPLTRGLEALRLFGLDQVSHRSIRELSLGQKRRAIFAAAFIGTPKHILLDEPLETMDRRIQDEVLTWIRVHLEARAVIALVSHRIEPFIDLVTRSVGLKDGRTIIVDSLARSEWS